MTYPTIELQTTSQCQGCNKVAEAGTKVLFVQGKGVFHLDCPTQKPETPKDTSWSTDEFGNRTWTHEGWTIKVWVRGTVVDCTGPEGEDVDVIDGHLLISHEADYDGQVTVSVPVPVLETFLDCMATR